MNLVARVAGQCFEHFIAPRPLVTCKSGLAQRIQLVQGGRHAGPADDRSAHTFPLQRIWDAKYRHLAHGGVIREHPFDFQRIDVLVPGIDHLLRASNDGKVTAALASAEIAGVDSVSADGLRGCLLVAPIAHHPHVAVAEDLTDFADCDVASFSVDDSHLAQQGLPAGGMPVRGVL